MKHQEQFFETFDNLSAGESYQVLFDDLLKMGTLPGTIKNYVNEYNSALQRLVGRSVKALTFINESDKSPINEVVVTKNVDYYRGMFDAFDSFIDDADNRDFRFILSKHENGELMARYARRRSDLSHIHFTDSGVISGIIKKFSDPFIDNLRATLTEYNGPDAFLVDNDEYVVRTTVSRECKRHWTKLSLMMASTKENKWAILHKGEPEAHLLACLLGMGLTKPDAKAEVERIKSTYL